MTLSYTEANLTQATVSELNRAHEILYNLTNARFDDADEIMRQMTKITGAEVFSEEYRYLKVRYEDARTRADEEYRRFMAVQAELRRRNRDA